MIVQAGIVNFYEVYNRNNALFKPGSYSIGDDFEYAWVTLRNRLAQRQIGLDTLDMHPLANYESIIFLDVPSSKSIPGGVSLEELNKAGKKLYLIIFESDLIKPDNWDKGNHKYFEKIFTWNDSLVDGKKYFKYYWPNKLPKDEKFDLSRKSKFCTLIAGNKESDNPRELYSKRVEAIRWFERNHPHDLDLFGMGWESKRKKSALRKLLYNNPRIRSVLDKNYFPSYRGKIERKRAVLSQYRFSICYENARDIPGYITEKIFDCLFARVIPVYWGAPDIEKFIPRNVFIDKRDFASYEDLYSYMKNMSAKEFQGYQDNMERFLKSETIRRFSAENFADTIIEECF